MNKYLFQPRRRIEKRYENAIKAIMGLLKRKLRGTSSPFLLVRTLRGFARSPDLDRLARQAAQGMATNLFVDGAKDWREAARKGSKGRIIYNALRRELDHNTAYYDIIDRNSELIKSVPGDLAERISNIAAKKAAAGERSDSVMEDILKMYPKLTAGRARVIARTETSKASTALTRTRCNTVGVKWYIWRTSEDARVRDSHRHMDGVIVSWNEPPSPEKLVHQKSYGNYHAGDIFNCRCYPEPLLDYNDVSFPHKVYYQGKIQYMTLAKFKKIQGGG